MTTKIAVPTDPIVRLVFADTIQARMFRTLCRRGEMPQAEFMNLYHARCHRTNPGRSSFGNNFGRFVSRYVRETGSYVPFASWRRADRLSHTPAIITMSAIDGSRNLLHWSAYPGVIGPREEGIDHVAAFVASMSVEDRYLAFTAIEKLVTAPREYVDDDLEDLVYWFRMLRAPRFLDDLQVAA